MFVGSWVEVRVAKLVEVLHTHKSSKVRYILGSVYERRTEGMKSDQGRKEIEGFDVK